jgi:hypothetical protein
MRCGERFPRELELTCNRSMNATRTIPSLSSIVLKRPYPRHGALAIVTNLETELSASVQTWGRSEQMSDTNR